MPAKASKEGEHPATVLHRPEGELVLCLRGGGYDGKVLRVRSHKCTFGGGADCTVQVPEIATLQCVILRGPGGTVVRDWTGASRLNDKPFSDAALHVGDRLQVGPLEARVLADCFAETAASSSTASRCESPLASTQHAGKNMANQASGSAACPSEIHDRFDRLESRLTGLERMIGELLHRQHRTNTHWAAAETPSLGPISPDVPGEDCDDMGTASSAFPDAPASDLPSPDSSLPSDSSPPCESEKEPASEATCQPQPPVWTEPKHDEELDRSVREYIAQLLTRVNDSSAESLPAAEVDSPAAQKVEPAEQEAVAETPCVRSDEELPVAATTSIAEESPEASWEPPLLAPLSLRPESEFHLNAMREVANMSATAAIRDFEQTQAARKTFDRLPLLLTGLACGLMLLYSAFASGKSGMFVGAGAAFVGAALTAWQLLTLARRWWLASRPLQQELKAGEQA